MDERLTDRELEILSGYVSGIVPRPSRATVGRLITELRAAREVVEAAGALSTSFDWRIRDSVKWRVLIDALARYEKVVKRD